MRNVPVFCLLLTALMVIGTAVIADAVSVRFWSDDGLVLVERGVPEGMGPVEAAVRALIAGPTQPEVAAGVSSRIPAGVTITSLAISDTSVEVDMSAAVLIGLEETRLQDIFDQFRTTLGDFPAISTIRLTCEGKLLSSYLSPTPQVGPPADSGGPAPSGVGLSGKKISVGPSHGKFWNGGGWYWQRTLTCGWGEEALEDTNSIRLVTFLRQYLIQDGATFTSPRQLDQSDCCNSDTGLPWWKMCASTWLHHAGVSSSIWASSSGNSGADSAVDRSSDDIRARPLYADSQGADIYIAHHTNAGGGGTANGTETFRDTAMEHSAHETNSYNLASAVQSSVISTIRSTFPGESAWADRGVKDSAGGFGEIRIPDRPAILIELAFHDNCSRDAAYLTDDFFRSVSEWAIYNGICSYFGNTPTWGKYSCEYVSDTIPTTMNPGQSYNVSVTYRNRGVSWFTSRGFRLGAVGDSDPFATFTRVDISGQVKPGDTYTFNFTLTAPAAGGTYVTDWQMVRDDYAWFGPTVSKTVDCGPNLDFEPPSVPSNIHSTGVTPSSITLAWDASTDNYAVVGYRVYRNGAQVGTTTSASYTDSGLNYSTSYSYQVDAYDVVPNYSAKSAPVALSTPAPLFYTWSRTTSNADTYIRSGNPTVAGNGFGIQSGWSSTASIAIRRGLVRWDMTGAPAQAAIVNASNSARVKLYCYTRSVNTATNIYLNKVNADWTEGNATWNSTNSAYDQLFATTSVTIVGDYTWSWNGNTLGLPPANRGVIVRNQNESSANPKIFNDRENYGAVGVYPRLEVDYYDIVAPVSCGISINGGATDTASAAVTLALSATDSPSGMGPGAQMQFSDDGVTYSPPEAYASSRNYTLPGDDGVKTVYVKYSDVAGNWSSAVSDTITLDTSVPTSSADPVGGVYNAAQNVTLSASETGAAIHYTTDGTEPTTGSSTYSSAIPVSADTTLRFFAVDEAGNTESPANQDVYTILTTDGLIADARKAPLDTPIALGDKVLYYESGSFGYIEEISRVSGIRVEGTVSAEEGQLVCLTGTRGQTADGEPMISVTQMTPNGPGTVAPWGTNSRAFSYNLLSGLYVTTWGVVKVGSVSPDSYVITTGSADTEIKVITRTAPAVNEGDFVIVTGAVGFGTTKAIYQK